MTILHRSAARPRTVGIVALLVVIAIGAILLMLGLSAAYVGQTEAILAGQSDNDLVVRNLANACLEEAMLRLKLDSSYAGGTVSVGNDSCTVAVTVVDATHRTIVTSASKNGFTKSLSVAATRKTNTANSALGWHIDTYTELDP